MKPIGMVMRALPAIAALVLATGCGKGNSADEAGTAEKRVVSVEVVEVETGRIEDWVDLPGRIEPYREVRISAEVGGLVEWIGVEEGDEVKKGTRLVVIDRENLELQERQAMLALEQSRIGVESALIAVEQAEAALESGEATEVQAAAALAQALELEKKARSLRAEAEKDRDRGRALYEEELAPRSSLDNLELALEAAAADLASSEEGVKAARAGVRVAAAGSKALEAGLKASREQEAAARSQVKAAEASLDRARLFLRKSAIVSPIDGYVDLSYYEAGELVGANDELFRIVQTRPAKAVFHLPEKDVPFLSAGAEAAVTISALSDKPFTGVVSLIGVTTDPATSTYRLEVDIPNGRGIIRPGMLARLRLLRRGLEAGISVPIFTVLAGEKESFLFVYSEGKAHRRQVETGIVDGERVQVTAGVEAGEQVIVKGQRDLEDGQIVAVP